MNSAIKNGKKPVAQRQRAPLINSDDIFNNPLSLDPAMIKTIEDKEHAYRFINYKHFVEMGGSHPAHWKPVSRKTLKEWGYDTLGLDAFLQGSDADGFVRRQDLVLAVRPKSINDKHKAYLRQEAERVQSLQEKHAADLREYNRQSGLRETVHEGYEGFAGDKDEDES